MTFPTKGRERMIRTLHESVGMILDDLDSTCIAGFLARLKRKMELNYLSIMTFYFGGINEGKDISEIRQKHSVRRQCARCLIMMEHIRRRSCMSARKMGDICEARESKKYLIHLFARSDFNVVIE